MDFRTANALVRLGRFSEAREIYVALARARPELSLYRTALAACERQLLRAPASQGADAPESRHRGVIVDANHPESRQDTSGVRVIRVVTPVLNGERHIDDTIRSVIGQAGNFFIDYVVKDGGSRDSTLDISCSWAHAVASGNTLSGVPLRCHGVRMRVVSERDSGLYDALRRGFEILSPADYDACTYINADDVLHEGTFEAVTRVFGRVSDANWLIGQPNVIDESGATIQRSSFPVSYNRLDILDGLHDGRCLNFIQQEGSFWLHSLYASAGGFDCSLRLAGDFALWRRFAALTEPLTLSRATASFRKRDGQLSEAMDRYYVEVDTHSAKDSHRGELLAPNDAVALQPRFSFTSGAPSPNFNRQRPGALCFLGDDNEVLEIAYVKRAWLNY